MRQYRITKHPTTWTNFFVQQVVIQSIKIYKASALDKLPSRLVKDAFMTLCRKLQFLFNLSLSTGIFPSDWKKANVILIPKDSDKSNPTNYRPISLLPLPGKLLEKIIHGKLLDFWTAENLITSRQGGFRPGHSTQSTTLNWCNDSTQQ